MSKKRFYNDEKFLGSMSGRPLRILSEYLGPLSTLQRNKIKDTIVFFGSARIKNKQEGIMNYYYQKARDLAFRLTKWNRENYKDEYRFTIASGAGPGIMQAANQGAKDAGGKSIGLGCVRVLWWIGVKRPMRVYFVEDCRLSFPQKKLTLKNFLPLGIARL